MLYSDLKNMNVGLIFEAAAGSTSTQEGLVNAGARVRSQAAGLSGVWEGDDSLAASTALETDSLPVTSAGDSFGTAAQILSRLGEQLAVEQAVLLSAIARATAIPGMVDEAGIVIPLIPPLTLPPVAAAMQAAATALTMEIAGIVARANGHDQAAAAALAVESVAPDDPPPGEEGSEQFKFPQIPPMPDLSQGLGSGGSYGGPDLPGLGEDFGGEYDPSQPGGGLAGAGGSFGGLGAAGSGMGPAGAGWGAGSMTAAGGASIPGAAAGAAGMAARPMGMGMMPMGAGMARDDQAGDGSRTWLTEDDDPFGSDEAAPPVFRGTA
ncbi:hypothetical protein LX16_1103 [Stackebrandtia albiflava]|uniref:PPE family protein n=1 Tax=Stackebrandtia albiflava TaxID=406432 RepID=A0A562VC10_9ACTN|nr:hypothetical protein [Stackebrandtia albiflava]TWJ15400.1 hypothetical protein LX16_1103 [Stackebrandtia albiflava]